MAAAFAVATALCACSDDGNVSDDEAGGPSLPAPPTPTPLRPDEQVLGRASGVGPVDAAVTGRSDDVVIVYATCVHQGGEMRARVTLPRPEELTAACDAVVSRAQIFTERGQRFGVDVDVDDGVAWELVVTSRRDAG